MTFSSSSEKRLLIPVCRQVKEITPKTVNGSITFEAPLYGDANCDGAITTADAAVILRMPVGLSRITARGLLNADADGDGDIAASDAAIILRCIVGLITAFPVEEP